jgi:hypothetical protein
LLTLATLAAAGWKRSANVLDEALLAGCLTVVMILISPVCHLHYFALLVPLVMTLMAFAWHTAYGATLDQRWRWLFAVNAAGTALPHLPVCQILKDLGLATYVSLALWGSGVFELWHSRRSGANSSLSI